MLVVRTREHAVLDALPFLDHCDQNTRHSRSCRSVVGTQCSQRCWESAIRCSEKCRRHELRMMIYGEWNDNAKRETGELGRIIFGIGRVQVHVRCAHKDTSWIHERNENGIENIRHNTFLFRSSSSSSLSSLVEFAGNWMLLFQPFDFFLFFCFCSKM